MPILCGCPGSTKQILLLPSFHRNTSLPTSRDCILNSLRHGTISREPSKENSAALQGFSSPCSPYIEECFILPVLLFGSITQSQAHSQAHLQVHSQVISRLIPRVIPRPILRLDSWLILKLDLISFPGHFQAHSQAYFQTYSQA